VFIDGTTEQPYEECHAPDQRLGSQNGLHFIGYPEDSPPTISCSDLRYHTESFFVDFEDASSQNNVSFHNIKFEHVILAFSNINVTFTYVEFKDSMVVAFRPCNTAVMVFDNITMTSDKL